MYRTRIRILTWAALSFAAALGGAAADAPQKQPEPADKTESVQELMTKELTGMSGKELRMLTVEYLPAGASLPHRHHAQVFVYVLSGSVRMQVAGSALVTLGPGQTFYEGRDDEHIVSANASRTAPAKILVFMVRDKETPVAGDGTREGR